MMKIRLDFLLIKKRGQFLDITLSFPWIQRRPKPDPITKRRIGNHGPLSVNLDGIPTGIKRLKIDLKRLILDIENPRIQYFLDTRQPKRVGLET